MNILLLNVPETIVLFAFLLIAVNFKTFKVLNAAVTFVLMLAATVLTQALIPDKFLCASVGIIAISAIWFFINVPLSTKNFLKVLGGVTFAFFVMMLCEIYIPVILIITGTLPSVLDNVWTAFFYSLPSRVIEAILICAVYKAQDCNFPFKVASRAIAATAKSAAGLASWWWVYQPKTPKSLLKNTHP